MAKAQCIISQHWFWNLHVGVTTWSNCDSLTSNVFTIWCHILISMFNVALVSSSKEFQSLCLTLNVLLFILWLAEIILYMRPVNERWHCSVKASLIGWAHTQNDPWISHSDLFVSIIKSYHTVTESGTQYLFERAVPMDWHKINALVLKLQYSW